MNLPDPNQLIDALAEQIRPNLMPNTAMLGIHTGGVWVMEALAERLGGDIPCGVLDIAFYRDDFSRIGLHPQVKPSSIPFDVEGRNILLVDDVLYTGRTIRAAMNLVFDYGRPNRIRLAVLVDRGGRELPICAHYTGATLDLGQHICLVRDAEGRFDLVLKEEAK
ncbi:bifunctional pyr operon transcriptional regulator/uracil phosphoribosyltransferase PyrR [Parasulfuritortus cantonensis]|uniref:Bifunctional pyr operon transcriptional regulator/uracil phosphoribosyltransferase PyrR n=1 Tax=Parasulfuritortus cantonensis TaxID=2528202 RepID=A0A4R1B7Z6_9PROT|nr:bifunctional pyr operon transcriptional regulator/uracil phosphoribosyltransferase PyrR [Parasulfuritortus cantonensis]TCJ11939.1 bifunctional pyr operon transcriptional regulator/uracil phosphoribosyltransferase PyrR [Parasulfuritortus cantonensis]